MENIFVEDLPNEVWKKIDTSGRKEYFVSNKGRVKKIVRYVNLKGVIKEKICPYHVNNRRRFVTIISENRSIHQLVAIHFLENPLFYTDVNHKNLDSEDNRVENLEWVSKIDNCLHWQILTTDKKALYSVKMGKWFVETKSGRREGKSSRYRVKVAFGSTAEEAMENYRKHLQDCGSVKYYFWVGRENDYRKKLKSTT